MQSAHTCFRLDLQQHSTTTVLDSLQHSTTALLDFQQHSTTTLQDLQEHSTTTLLNFQQHSTTTLMLDLQRPNFFFNNLHSESDNSVETILKAALFLKPFDGLKDIC